MIQPTLPEPSSTPELHTADAVPVRPPAHFDRADWLSAGVASAVMFLVYAGSLALEVTLANSGMLATGAFYAGVPSVPGYPAWVLYSWLFANLIPFGSVAWRVALGSALASAVTCGLLALLTCRLGKHLFADSPRLARLSDPDQGRLRAACGSLAALGFGLSDPVWSQAVIVETWAMTNLLVALILVLLLRWALSPQSKRFLLATVFAFGLLLTNAQQMVVLAPAIAGLVLLVQPRLGRDFAWSFLPLVALVMLPSGFPVYESVFGEFNLPLLAAFALPLAAGMVVVWLSRAFGSHWKFCGLAGALLLAGLPLYLFPGLASLTNPPANWAYPRDVSGFWHMFQRGQFERVVPVKNVALFTAQMKLLLLTTAAKLGWHYAVFALLPVVGVFWLSRNGRCWMGAVLLVWLCAGPLLLSLINPPVELGGTHQMMLYFAPAMMPAACLTGWGLMLCAALLVTDRTAEPKCVGAGSGGAGPRK